MTKKTTVLCILDGWGWRAEREHNAIKIAPTPTWDKFIATYPKTFVKTFGLNVGLPDGQMGNSEVGHMNIGAGRVIMQSLPMIDLAFEKHEIEEKPAIKNLIAELKTSGKTAHLMGLFSPGGIHSHQNHILMMAKILDSHGINVALHLFLDGRDTPPKSALGYAKDFEKDIASLTHTRIATVGGRYWGMDRNKNWDRVKLAYDAMVASSAPSFQSASEGIAKAYEKDETDEFVKPFVVEGFSGMQDGDALLMINFRADRVRQILAAFADPKFAEFARERTVSFSSRIGMTEYSKELNEFFEVVFPPTPLKNILGEIISNAAKTQLRLAETEKYAHVTFFFNGGEEKTYPGEERILVPSPDVATYDLRPEMSALEVCKNLTESIRSGKFDLIVVNFANGDMVGHTGKMDAAMKAVETIDNCLAEIEKALIDANAQMLVTADHGNVEIMQDEAGNPHTQHTAGVVRAFIVNSDASELRDVGSLCDIAPTILDLMGLPKPAEMTGSSLIVKKIS